jgi:hypothetical protein
MNPNTFLSVVHNSEIYPLDIRNLITLGSIQICAIPIPRAVANGECRPVFALRKCTRVVTPIDLSGGRNDVDLLSSNTNRHEKWSCRQWRTKSQSTAPTRVAEEIPSARTGTRKHSEATRNQDDIKNDISDKIFRFLAPRQSSRANSHNTSSHPNWTTFHPVTGRRPPTADVSVLRRRARRPAPCGDRRHSHYRVGHAGVLSITVLNLITGVDRQL